MLYDIDDLPDTDLFVLFISSIPQQHTEIYVFRVCEGTEWKNDCSPQVQMQGGPVISFTLYSASFIYIK